VLFALPTFTSRWMSGAISLSRKRDGLLVALTLGHHRQAIRAILLASAMAAIFVGRRANNAVSQGRCLLPWILA
jgi:hypothetical protein